ncbi:MAG: hypothetical protein HN368_06075, partial [Spirochaetales bacterium]|nr:hypothetical protein [Spirochaetales bacterium]
WGEYVEKDIVSRDENGEIILLDHPNNPDAKMNWTSYTREWEEGLAQRRIDDLIDTIPELVDAHTIHLDNLNTYYKPENRPLSPWHARPENGGIDMYKEVETIRKIFRRFRDRGIDVTGEGILWAHPPGEGFYGIQGYAWWGSGSEHSLQVPERLSARGAVSRSLEDWDVLFDDYRFSHSMHGETPWMLDSKKLPGFLHRFCTMTLPWYYLSRHERLAMIDDVLYYSDGLIAGEIDGRKTIRKGDYVLVEDGNVFVEAGWNENEIIAYSTNGYSDKEWVLPESWRDIAGVDIYRISLSGLNPITSGVAIEAGRLNLTLGKGEAVSIVPHGTEPGGMR